MRISSIAPLSALFVLLALGGCKDPVSNLSIKSDASLSAITLDAGVLRPTFSPTTLYYTVDLANDLSQLTVTGTATQSVATVTNPSSPAVFAAGNTRVLEISVLAADQKTTMVYQISVTRAALPPVVVPLDPTDASLKSLTLYTGKLTPAFDPLVTDYSVSLPYSVSKFSATGVATQSGAVVTNPPFQNSLTAGASVSLEVSVLAADQKTTKVYRIAVNRANVLGGITVSAGMLNPAFSSSVYDYQVTVPTSVTSVTVTGTPSNSGGTVTGPDVLTGLVVGQPQVSTLTLSSSGTFTEYRVSVTRSDQLTLGQTTLEAALSGDDVSLFKLVHRTA